MVRFIIINNTFNKTNSFLIAKIKTILVLMELISKKESWYINTFNTRDSALEQKD